MPLAEGILRLSLKGIGFLTPLDRTGRPLKGPGIEIAPADLNTALHGDRVKVSFHPPKADKRLSGQVKEILARGKTAFSGVLEKENGAYLLRPDDKRMYVDILVAPDKLKGAKLGQKVYGRIIEWSDPKRKPIGEILAILGRPGEHDTEMKAIIFEKGFRPDFPKEVEQEAKKIRKGAAADLKKEIAKRRDCRLIPTFTIDPEDAKDFDDAISVQKLPDHKVEIGIHIADVSHYVRPGTALDREARWRATSVYLVDRTIPMLPEILSNDLCSLNPNEDKLAFSAIFIFDQKFKLLKSWFGRSVIRSAHRFTYETAQKVLQTGRGPLAAELKIADEAAKKLRAEKTAAGAIDFGEAEIKFVLDRNGRPIQILRKKRLETNQLIEDLMLLANRRVAEFVSQRIKNEEGKFVYRIHDEPDPEKVRGLAEFATPLGYRFNVGPEGVTAADINDLLKQSRGKPEENILNTLTRRAMSKAVYATKNIGHFGLSFAHYAHFTSPIRRYPDIMVHRLLYLYLHGKHPGAAVRRRYEKLAWHCSEQEIQAQEAERESIRYKQIEYLQNKIGHNFKGVISGVTQWGIFVEEQETLADGFVRLSDLKDDFYIFNERQYALLGQKTGRRYRLGDVVRLKLLRADLATRQIDFLFI